MTTTYYHVASARWEPGDDLLCWNRLVELGMVTDADWRWNEADAGFDGDVICMFHDRSEAEEYQSERDGRLVTITVPDEYEELGHRVVTVEEGYPAVVGRVPADWITP